MKLYYVCSPVTKIQFLNFDLKNSISVIILGYIPNNFHVSHDLHMKDTQFPASDLILISQNFKI